MLMVENFMLSDERIQLIVKSDKDKSALMAFSLSTPDEKTPLLVYNDGDRYRTLEVLSIIEDSADRLTVMTVANVIYTFEMLTLESYNDYVKGKLWDNPDFKTEEEMGAYFDDDDEIQPPTFTKPIE